MSNNPTLPAPPAQEVRDLRAERDSMRDWIMQAAPLLSTASCIVIDAALERLPEIAGCRAVLESCPVDFINPPTTPIMDAAQEWNDRRDLIAQIGLLEIERNGARSALDAFRDRISELEDSIHQTIMENLHLADGDVCTLKRLKDTIGFSLSLLDEEPTS
jgi:hypothetical protein